jgi:hypothetical protein
MGATKEVSAARIKNELTALKQRVTWLEQALRPKKARAAARQGNVDLSRQIAEQQARSKAINEFFDQKARQRYREFPHMLEDRRKFDREINEFLEARGLAPIKSDIPKGLGRVKKSQSESV